MRRQCVIIAAFRLFLYKTLSAFSLRAVFRTLLVSLSSFRQRPDGDTFDRITTSNGIMYPISSRI